VRFEVKPVSPEEQYKEDETDREKGDEEDEDDEYIERTAAPMFSLSDPKVGEDCAHEVMGICGFENMVDSCTQQSIHLPKGKESPGHVFYCCQGEMGSGIWTVLVRGKEGEGDHVVEVVATYLPRAAYDSLDLEPFDYRICNFVAYQDEYVG